MFLREKVVIKKPISQKKVVIKKSKKAVIKKPIGHKKVVIKKPPFTVRTLSVAIIGGVGSAAQ